MNKNTDILTPEDLTAIESPLLNEKQYKILYSRTPARFTRERPAKGGGKWTYVTAGYVKKVLNFVFGGNWDFEIVDDRFIPEAKQVLVKGRLTVRADGNTIVKMQYGRADVKYRKSDQTPLDLGNDFKAAASDALKKCASEIGVAADVYNPQEFKEANVGSSEDQLDQLIELFDFFGEQLRPDDKIAIEQIIEAKEKVSYSKAIKILNQIKNGK